MTPTPSLKFPAIIGAVVLGLLVLMSGCSVVGPGERGVAVSLGKASTETLEPGPHLAFPFLRSIKRMSVQIQKTDITASASSKDLQEVTTVASLNWHINPADVSKIYTTIGSEDSIVGQIIIPAFNETLKQATAKKTAEEVISKRAELKKEVDEVLIARLKDYGVYVDDINIVDVKFGEDFSHAIEQKQVAEQKSKQAHYEALQREQEAIGAVNAAKGQAEAQRLVKQSIDKDIIALKWIEKWNGVLPATMTGAAMPMLNLGGAK